MCLKVVHTTKMLPLQLFRRDLSVDAYVLYVVRRLFVLFLAVVEKSGSEIFKRGVFISTFCLFF